MLVRATAQGPCGTGGSSGHKRIDGIYLNHVSQKIKRCKTCVDDIKDYTKAY